MRIGVANLGNASGSRVLEDLLNAMQDHDVLLLCEAGDRRAEIDQACRQLGWFSYFGSAPGSPATPVLWNPKTAPVNKRLTHRVSGRTWTGRHPRLKGPSWTKAKNLVAIHVVDYGWLATFHMPASQWWLLRLLLARADARRIARWVKPRGRVVLGMDGNRRKPFRVLRRARMHPYIHEVMAAYVKNVGVTDVHTVHTSSDHPMLSITTR